jgi:flagellar hook-length control protein FliK
MGAMNVSSLQAQLTAPASQTQTPTPSSMSAMSSAGAQSRHEAGKAAATDKPAAGKSDAASGAGSARARARSRSRSAARASGQPQWLLVMSQAMAAGESKLGLPGAMHGDFATDHAQDGEADGEADEVGAVGANAARQGGAMGAIPADLSAMQDALALVPGGASAALPVLGKTAGAVLNASHEASEEANDGAPASDTAKRANGDTSLPQTRLPSLADLAPQAGDRSANDAAQPAAVARLAERAADSARQEAASGDAGGSRGAASAQPAAASTGNGLGSLASALQAAGTTEWAPVALKGDASKSWQGQLMDALGERVEVQMKHGIDNAVIRLDPPMLGSVQIDIRHENGALQVHLVATHDEVARQLESISNALQNELAQKQYTDVAVVVRNGGSMGQGEGRGQARDNDEQRAPGRALDDAYASNASGTEQNNAGA